MGRPLPPESLTDIESLAFRLHEFVPDQYLAGWVRGTFIEDGAPLHNETYEHLQEADIGFLWTNAPNAKNGKAIIGSAELGTPMVAAGKWLRARLLQQLHEWFGDVPDFIITLDADWCAQADDVSFCAVVEHELHHCGQEHDECGAPKFGRDGQPKYAIRAHDVEEFTGVVSRYGMDATRTRELVEAAKAGPMVGRATINGACGACLKGVA